VAGDGEVAADVVAGLRGGGGGGAGPSKLVITLEGAGVLAPDRLEQAAEGLQRLTELGVFHAIVVVHPRLLTEAGPVMGEFGGSISRGCRGRAGVVGRRSSVVGRRSSVVGRRSSVVGRRSSEDES
jgi:hypothetical protein